MCAHDIHPLYLAYWSEISDEMMGNVLILYV